ncbi:LysM peptidoglycan-binding domain-containing C40 family peptidase [Streptacidiphilus sp. PB12-B1b]|nr:LysM peptidoglycan-binding domain-containing C40 family peptidase [Streptacidiphilus sp. PB12-B1b]
MLLSSRGRHRAVPARRTATQRLLAGAGIASVVGMAVPLAGATSAMAAPSSSASAASTTPAPAVAAAPTSAGTPRRAAAPAGYTVVAGDWLSTIAQKHHVSGGWERLYALNRSTLTQGPDLIYPGEHLVLDGTVVASHTSAPAAPAPSTPASTTSTSGSATGSGSGTGSSDANTAASAAAQAAYNAATSAGSSTGSSASSNSGAGSGSASGSTSGDSATTTAPSSSSGMAAAIAFAQAQVGKAYVYGATGPDAWDCSGLTQAALAQAGISIPRTSEDQAAAATPVSMNALQPGDLLFWSSDGTAAGAYHVAIYIGNGSYVEAANPSAGVKIDTISDYTPTFAGRF